MKSERLCPICKMEHVEILHSQHFELPRGHPLSDGYDVTVVSQADYDKFYAENSKYEDSKTGTGGVENPYDWKRQQETAKQIADFLQNPKASILDVGCANGGLLKALKEIGYNVLCGIDPSPVCVDNTLNLGIEAYQGSLFQDFYENAYDCVILSHTLEHVADVRGALEWIEKRLKKNGIVYLETPDASRYVEFNYAPFQDFNTEHINHFSLASIQNLMRLQEFDLIECGEKTSQTSSHTQYPAIFGFWKKSEKPSEVVKDTNLKEKIKEYIFESKAILDEIETHLQKILLKFPQIVVWGTGQLTMKLLVETSLARADILAFVDSNPINHGKVLKDIPIINPEKIATFDVPILISTLLHHHAIAEQIRMMGTNNEILFLKD